ncbi:MAG: Uma2 family endonuclease [Actinomycetota bacterium]
MPSQRLLTYEDLKAFPDDGKRREILNGRLFVSPSPFRRHQEVLGRLHLIVGNHVHEHGGGKVYFGPLDVLLSLHNVLEPDMMFISSDQFDIMTEKNIQGPPALAIEIVSSSRMDRVRKKPIYAEHGVKTYWVVDPKINRVEVYRLVGKAYGEPEILGPPQVLTYEGLPGLEIPLGDLFAD